MNPEIPWRQIVRDELELLASEEEQLAYEKNVPHVDITTELKCGWFDDSYHPDDKNFCSCFSENELEVLARFSNFYDSRCSLLPESNGTVRTWLQTPVWREVMREAQLTLKCLAA
jgi:hypothetical protein